ncbi:MAG: hypothetical protein JMDDDDMK_05711 [Acidobacteria bacterium]|nr:hypothetical protein [Acidobacteriota bacterium]
MGNGSGGLSNSTTPSRNNSLSALRHLAISDLHQKRLGQNPPPQTARAGKEGALRRYKGHSWTVTDGFGRAIESWTRHPQGDVKVSTAYDALGRVKQTSNPHRSGETPVYTTTNYDLAGRVTSVTTPDGATVSTAYDGARVMVTDQANKKRISETDGLGRLLKVWEIRSADSDTVSVTFPQTGGTTYNAYLTQYAYDVLDDLTTVSQGAQTRTFVYDSLKRLTSATNPESGLMSYVYDANGNLLEKTDARTAKTTFSYDALNRVKSKVYSGATSEGINAANATPPVYFKYDSQAFPSGAPAGFNRGLATGRLVSVNYGAGSSAGNYFGYDELGRTVRKTQQINGNNYAVPSVSYNRASAMTGETYPSGRTVSYSYDIAGRLNTFSGTLGDGVNRTYATVTQYSAAGLKERETYNGTTTPLFLKLHYNKRQQMVDLRLGSVQDEWNYDRGALIFYYGTNAVANWNPFQDDADNNGNVRRQVNYVPKPAGGGDVIPQLDDYYYDDLNRISSFTEWQLNDTGSWASNVVTQNFAYDRYGNRRVTSATGGVSAYNPAYTATNNRISGLTYDAAGNITFDAATGGTMTYDAENRLLTATSGGGGSYAYDGEGKRVKRTLAGGQTWWYVYGIGGELVAEYLASAPTTVKKEYGYRGGQLLVVWNADEAAADKKLKWLVTDHLGSTRMEADKSGSLAGMRRHDYAPFGEEMYAGIRQSGGVGQYGYEPPQSNVKHRFGSKERDNETGLDYFGARYYASVQGRFTSPDLPKMDLVPQNPQSMNRYAYVRNNPCANIDPTGRCSAPSGLKAGQVGICVEAYIATKRLPGIYVLGRGDGRGPGGNDPKLTSRIEAKLIASPNADGKGYSIGDPQVKAAKSEVDIPFPVNVAHPRHPAGGPTTISLQGTGNTNTPAGNVDQSGNTNFTLTGTAQNGFQANNIPGPGGTIDFKLDFQISPDGAASVNEETSTTREYPTYAAYSYVVDGQGNVKVTKLFVRDEKDIGGLKREQTPIRKKEQ